MLKQLQRTQAINLMMTILKTKVVEAVAENKTINLMMIALEI